MRSYNFLYFTRVILTPLISVKTMWLIVREIKRIIKNVVKVHKSFPTNIILIAA